MLPIPNEFDPSQIALKSEASAQMYRAELATKDPMRAVLADNPEIYFVPPKRRQEWGQWEYKPGAYYDTTRGSLHPHWQGQDLPRPTKDIARLRSDFLRWGYCMIEDALSEAQVSRVLTRVLEQAEGERLAGIAQRTPSGQNINCCVNKGRCFEGLIAQDPEATQGGPLIEQLVTEALGANWVSTSLIASIALKGGVPQALHQDQDIALDSKSPVSYTHLTLPTSDLV